MSGTEVRFDFDFPDYPHWKAEVDSDSTLAKALAGRPRDLGLAQELEQLEQVRAVCIFGSAARGQADSDSDLDLLVVTPADAQVSEIRAQLKPYHAKGGTQIRLMTEDRLRQSFDRRTVFAAHLAREARVCVDRDGIFQELFDEHPKDAPVLEDGKSLRSRLKAYDDLDWCGGRYLLCLADIHAWGRSGAMLALARRGEFEFGRDKVFPSLVAAYPHLERAAETVEALRPFWLAVRRRQHVAFPFPADGSHKETAAARDACREILTTVP